MTAGFVIKFIARKLGKNDLTVKENYRNRAKKFCADIYKEEACFGRTLKPY